MIEFLMSFLVIAVVIVGMAVGVLNGRAPISGSCGGLNNLGVDGACEICGGNPSLCEEVGDIQAASPDLNKGFVNALDDR